MKIRVAGSQIMVSRDVQQNVAALCEAIQTASSADADITPQGDWACRTVSRGPQFFSYTIDLGDEG